MKEVRNLAHSVYDRLRNKARELGLPFDWVLLYYANERFLYRLSKSKYCDQFILKGGLVFTGWGIPLRRHTTDIDFRGFADNSPEHVISIIEEICILPVEDDGMTYDSEAASAEAISAQAEYPGVRVKFRARLGSVTQVRMQVDIGFSDKICPAPEEVNYPTLLEMPAPWLRSYPKETVVAEKLHCMAFRGSMNSRRKDFYDIWFICQNMDFDGPRLQVTVVETFSNRGLSIPRDMPTAFTAQFAEDNQVQWQAFLRTFNPDTSEVKSFARVIDVIRRFLLPVLSAAAQGKEFNQVWDCSQSKWLEKRV